MNQKNKILGTAQEQAETIAFAFRDNYKFDVESAIITLSEQIIKKPLRQTEIQILSLYKQDKVLSSDVQKHLDYLKKFMIDSSSENILLEEEVSIADENLAIAEISSEMTKNDSDGTSSEPKELPDIKNVGSFIALTPVGNKGNYDIPHHPLLKSYPETNDLEKLALSVDFKENGIRNPILTYKGKLIDGRYRLESAEKLGLEFHIVEYQGDERELQSFMDSLHVLKKDYTPTQRAFMAYENKDRFRKQNTPVDKRNELEGAKPKRRHDSNKFANSYYKASAGEVAKVKKFAVVANGSLLYDYTKAGKINIDVALYLANINILNDEALLNLVYQHKLNSQQSRNLSFIQNDENLTILYQQIATESDSRAVKRLIKYYDYRQYDEILSDLMSSSIDLKQAQATKESMQTSSEISGEDFDNSNVVVEQGNVSPIIDSAIFNRISILANKSKLSVNQFLSNLIEGYELSQQGGSNEAA